MKKLHKALVAATVLSALSVQAQTTYFDAADVINSPSDYNLYLDDGTTPLLPAYDTDQNGAWTYWDIFPAAASWNASVYDLRYGQSDPDGIQRISGIADGGYNVLVYGVFSSSVNKHGAAFSLDGGSTWQVVERQTSDIHWVDNSSELGSPLAAPSGDTRFWVQLPIPVIVSGGTLDVLVRAPQFLSNGQPQDRFFFDGVALQVPEPSTFALAGLGAAALVIFRRRR